MPRTFKELDNKDQERFYARLKLLDIDPADVPETVTIGGGGAIGLYSKVIVVKDVVHLKAVFGVPDEDYTTLGHPDRHLVYPELTQELARRFAGAKGDAGALDRLLDAGDRETLRTALRAYVLGSSHQLDAGFADILNLLYFPMEATVSAAKNIPVTGEWLLGKDGPETVQAGTITIEPGGYIKCINVVTIDVGVLTRV